MKKPSKVLDEYRKRLAQSAFYRYRPYGHEDTLCTDGKLWKEMGWEPWSNKPWQLDFHNSPCKEKGNICANGVGKCTTINTQINTSRGKKRIGEIWGKPGIDVLTYPDLQPRRVTHWIRKPPEECFRIVMSDGQWFECPKGHLILTDSGYATASSVLGSLPKSVYDPLEKYSGFSRLIRALSVRRLFGTLRGCWGRYFVDPRLCGGRLLSEEDNVQVFLPSQVDAQKRNAVSCNLDGLGNICKYSPLQFLRRLSMNACASLRALGHFVLAQDQEPLFGYQPFFGERQSEPQSPYSSGLVHEGESTHSRQFLSSSSGYPLTIGGVGIVSVYSVGVHTLYDMSVEERHNYIAAGMVHHNSFSTLWETTAHLIGEYPDWYEGQRYDKPVLAWVGAIDASLQVEGVQQILLGNDLEENLGTGWIPRANIGKIALRQSGVPNTVHKVSVKHKSGGVSTLIFKTYAQGWKSWQTAKPDIIALDEQPDDNDNKQKGIFEECQTRLFRSSGIMLVGLTPLLGETDLTRHFMSGTEGVFCTTATWDDAPHLKEEDKARLRATYKGSSVQTRAMGVPMMGEGRVIEHDEDSYTCRPFEIPSYYAEIIGIDFGTGAGHPTAAARLVWNRDNDTVYLVDEYRKEGASALIHSEAIKRWGGWQPVAWPHDGHKTSDVTKEKADGNEVKDIYRKYGLNMLGMSARYERDKGGSQAQEPIIEMLNERIAAGKFYVFSTCNYFFEEARSFHRKDGKIVNRREDLIKAVLYGLMMLRYAYSNKGLHKPQFSASPLVVRP